jgi:hypothetical protein
MRRFPYPKPAGEAYHDLVRAVGQIGSGDSSSQLTRTVAGSVTVGFPGGVRETTLQASVFEADGGNSLIEADAMGGVVEAPEVYPLLLKALEDPTYKYKMSMGCLGIVLLFVGSLLGGAIYLVA